jgi:hypothetical protein
MQLPMHKTRWKLCSSLLQDLQLDRSGAEQKRIPFLVWLQSPFTTKTVVHVYESAVFQLVRSNHHGPEQIDDSGTSAIPSLVYCKRYRDNKKSHFVAELLSGWY